MGRASRAKSIILFIYSDDEAEAGPPPAAPGNISIAGAAAADAGFLLKGSKFNCGWSSKKAVEAEPDDDEGNPTNSQSTRSLPKSFRLDLYKPYLYDRFFIRARSCFILKYSDAEANAEAEEIERVAGGLKDVRRADPAYACPRA